MRKVGITKEKFGAFKEKILEGCPSSFDLKCVVDGDELRLEYTYSYDWLVRYGLLGAKLNLIENLSRSLLEYGWGVVNVKYNVLDDRN